MRPARAQWTIGSLLMHVMVHDMSLAGRVLRVSIYASAMLLGWRLVLRLIGG